MKILIVDDDDVLVAFSRGNWRPVGGATVWKLMLR